MSTSKGKIGKDLAAFRAAHDKSYIVPEAIKKGLAALGDSWEYEQEFVRRCGVSLAEFSRFREPFNEFCVEIGGKSVRRVWAGSKAYARKLKEAHDGNG